MEFKKKQIINVTDNQLEVLGASKAALIDTGLKRELAGLALVHRNTHRRPGKAIFISFKYFKGRISTKPGFIHK